MTTEDHLDKAKIARLEKELHECQRQRDIAVRNEQDTHNANKQMAKELFKVTMQVVRLEQGIEGAVKSLRGPRPERVTEMEFTCP